MNSAEIAYYQQRSSTRQGQSPLGVGRSSGRTLEVLKKLIVVSGEYQGSK